MCCKKKHLGLTSPPKVCVCAAVRETGKRRHSSISEGMKKKNAFDSSLFFIQRER